MNLLNLGTQNGVTAVMTADAGSALLEALMRMHYEESELREMVRDGHTLDLALTHPLLVERITRGTMTFVEATVWRESNLARTLHTGTLTELEELASTCTIEVVPSFPLQIPFSTGHDTHQKDLELGFGPKPELLIKLRLLAQLELLIKLKAAVGLPFAS